MSTDPKRSIEGNPKIGLWIQSANQHACEIAAALEFDAVVFDGEHGLFTPESQDRIIGLSRALRLTIYYRVANPDRAAIQQALDAGADALILPQIQNLEHARAASAFAKYPPLGMRGMGSPRSLNYGDTPDDFAVQANKKTKCYVMIETAGALADAEKIAALETVDGLFMGPYDLSLNRGRGQYGATPADQADGDAIASAAANQKKLLGMPAFSETDLKRATKLGAAIITVGDDISTLTEALRNNLLRVKNILSSK